MIDLPPPPARLLAEATEFHFTLSRRTLRAGPAIIQLANRGEDPHNLRFARVHIPSTAPGEVGEWSGRLKRGRYKLYCTLPGHEKAGMRTYVRVR